MVVKNGGLNSVNLMTLLNFWMLAMSRVIVIGTIGHGRAMAAAALMLALSNKHEVVFCDKPEQIKITKMPDFPEPVFAKDIQRKSKGDKRRDRSERRRKWGI